MASLSAAAAASKTPVPEPPAAWKTMSAPSSYSAVAAVLPPAGLAKAFWSAWSERYFISTLAFGLTALTPAS